MSGKVREGNRRGFLAKASKNTSITIKSRVVKSTPQEKKRKR